MSNVVIVGSQWGDEGKGKIVDWLSLEADVYEMGLDRKMHRFETWDEQLKTYNYDKEQSFFEILVPTSDTTKY